MTAQEILQKHAGDCLAVNGIGSGKFIAAMQSYADKAVEDYKEKLKADISKMMTLNGITRHPFKVEAAEILKLIDSIK